MLSPLYGTMMPLGRSYASTVAAFDPTALSGLVLWMKADSAICQGSTSGTTPAAATGDPIGYWPDLSGNSNNGSQTTSTHKPTLLLSAINGLPTVVCSQSVTQWVNLAATLTLGNTNDFCVYFIATTPTNGNATSPGLCNTVNGNNQIWNYNAGGGAMVDNTGNYAQPGDTTAASTSAAMRGRKSGTAYKWKAHGLTEVSGTNATIGTIMPTAVGIGAATSSSGGGGALGEVIVYNRALTTGEMTQVETYLFSRWGLTP